MMHERTRIVRVPLMWPAWADAQVLVPRTIFARRGVRLPVRFVAQELVHVEQMERLGVFLYWLQYLRLRLRYSYATHPMEVEAHDAPMSAERLEAAARVLGREAS